MYDERKWEVRYEIQENSDQASAEEIIKKIEAGDLTGYLAYGLWYK